jgi:hypothetical protein
MDSHTNPREGDCVSDGEVRSRSLSSFILNVLRPVAVVCGDVPTGDKSRYCSPQRRCGICRVGQHEDDAIGMKWRNVAEPKGS